MVKPYWNEFSIPVNEKDRKFDTPKYGVWENLPFNKPKEGINPADFYKKFFEEFDPAFFENVKKALAYMPYGYDKQLEERTGRQLLGQTDASIKKMSSIARAQGYGEDSGVAAGGARDLREQYVDQMGDVGAQLQFMAQNRPLMQALFIKTLLDPEGSANQLLGESSLFNASTLQNTGLWNVLGQALANVNWEKIFK